MAHGVIVTGEDTNAIQFCREFISYRNVHLVRAVARKSRAHRFICLSRLRNLDDGARRRRRIMPADGDSGASGSYRRPRSSGVLVENEHCILFFCEESAIDFGDWEGTVVVYDRTEILSRNFIIRVRGAIRTAFCTIRAAIPRSAHYQMNEDDEDRAARFSPAFDASVDPFRRKKSAFSPV